MPGLLVNGLGGVAGFGEGFIASNDDSSTGYIDLVPAFGSRGINVFGTFYTGLYLNNNGSVTFGEAVGQLSLSLLTVDTGVPIIAPFLADVDTRGGPVAPSRGGNSAGSNLVWYDLDAATGTFTATWDDVGYYNGKTDKANAFQLVLTRAGNAGDFNIAFRYENIDWTTGDFNGGTGGLGGTRASAGISAGDGVTFALLPASGSDGMLLLEDAGNSGTPGRFDFAMVNGRPVPTLSIDDLQVSEGRDGTNSIAFVTVRLSAPSLDDVTVNYISDDSTAGSTDFVTAVGSVSFAPGETLKVIELQLIGDGVIEPDESFSVQLSGASGAVIADGTATVRILNDDGLSISDVRQLEGTGAARTPFDFTIMLGTPSESYVSVNWATEAATAAAKTDFTAASGTVTFAPGETSKTVRVNVIAESVFEPEETFRVRLSGATNAAISDGLGIGTIVNDDGIVVSDAFVIEGTTGVATAAVNIRLLSAAAAPVSVNWATFAGTALAGSDFIGSSGTVTFAAGETVKTINIPIVADGLVEGNETFEVRLSSPSGAAIADATGIVTIRDNDGYAITDVSVVEGNSGTTDMTFTVSLASALATNDVVSYTLGGGTADLATDIAGALSGTVNFLAGETSKTITISIVGDTLGESDETFNITLGKPGGGTGFLRQTATGTIVEDDALLSLEYVSAEREEGDSGATAFTYTVTRSGDLSQTHTASYAVSGFELSPNDFVGGVLPTGSVTFAPGETSKTVTINVAGDTVTERDEFFFVELTSPSAGAQISASDNFAAGLVRNDDGIAISVRAGGFNIQEGSAGDAFSFAFFVERFTLESAITTVNYAITGSAGLNGADLEGGVLPSGTVTFNPGETRAFVNVTVLGDNAFEANETLTITLSNPSGGATVIDGSESIGIQNDDTGTGLSIAAASASKNEGKSGNTTPYTFTVTRSGDLSAATTANYAVSGPAVNGSDFATGVLPTGTVSFAAGETTKTITINVKGDGTVESNEAFAVTLSNAVGANISTPTATGTIINDDTSLSIAAVSANKAEGQSGPTAFTFEVTRNGLATGSQTVGYSVAANGALTAADFAGGVLPSGTVSFASGETVKTITINVAGDTTIEASEAFVVRLASPSPAVTLATATATGTIVNDDIESQLISFSEFPRETVNPTYTFASNSVKVTGTILQDTTVHPTPFLATSADFSGPLLVSFLNPVTHVDFVAGTFYDFQGPLIEIIGAGGQILSVSDAPGAGVLPFSFDFAEGISAIRMVDSPDYNTGFILDQLTFSGSRAPVTTISAVSIAAASADKAEGAPTTVTPYTFTVTRSGNTTGAASVAYAVTETSGSWIDFDDFAGGLFPSGVVSFAAGQTVKTITVPIVGDASIEDDESFTVTLLAPSSGVAIGTATAAGNVRNDDRVLNGVTVTGTSGNDTITPSASVAGQPRPGALNDRIIGLAGKDVIDGGAGADWMEGGGGDDRYTVDNSDDIIIEVNTPGAIDSVTSSASFKLTAFVENLTLSGSASINGTGNDLNNTIVGNAAANVIAGAGGNDRLTGGLGADVFIFDTALSATANVDTIIDFSLADDTFHLDDAIFAALVPGALSASAFVIAAAATNTSQRIIYDTAGGGRLFYDQDGAGGAAQVQFATIGNGVLLTAGDFLII